MKDSNEGTSHADELTRLLDQCAVALLAACGVTAAPADHPEAPGKSQYLAAFIGFGGEKVRGALTVVTPMPLLKRTHPLGGDVVLSENDASDWSREFVNQMLGRLKNQLLRRGVVLEISTPQAVLADRLRVVPSPQGQLIKRAYAVEALELLVFLDFAVAPDVVLRLDDAAAQDVEDVPTEGDLLLF
jgi:hypothetical protein